MKSSYVLLSAFVCAVLGGSVQAADVVLADSVIRPDDAGIAFLRPTKSIIVIDKKDIEKQGATTINEVLAQQPSIQVGLGEYGQIDIRGQGSEAAGRNLQVLIDGAPVTVLTSHPYVNDYNFVPTDQIEKIEIIPSGGSVVYGSGAVGGVVNITTNIRHMDKSERTVGVRYSSRGIRTSLGVGQRANERTVFRLDATAERQRYYFIDTFRNTKYVAVGVDHQLSNRDHLTIRASHLEETGQFIKQVTKEKFDLYGRNYRPKRYLQTVGVDKRGNKIQQLSSGYLYANRRSGQVNLTWKHRWDARRDMTWELFWQNGYFQNNDRRDQKMDINTKGIRANYRQAYGKTGQHSLLVGVDYYTQSARLAYDDYVRKGSKYQPDPLHFFYNKETRAVYVSNLLRVGRWDLTQGVRLDDSLWKFDKKAQKTIGKDKRQTKEIAWDVGAAYHYRPTGHVYVRAEQGFTLPDGVLVSDDNGKYIVPTKAENERYRMYEAGVRDKIGISTVSLTLFQSKTGNQFDRWNYFQKGFQRVSMNLLKTKRKGVELSLTQRMGKWRLTEGYTYLKGRSVYRPDAAAKAAAVKKTLNELSQESLKAVPRHKLYLRAEYRPTDTLQMGLSYTYVGVYRNFVYQKDADGNIVGSHAVVDFDWQWQYRKEVRIFGGVRNVFNRKYLRFVGEALTPGGYSVMPGEGRTYYVGVNYRF